MSVSQQSMAHSASYFNLTRKLMIRTYAGKDAYVWDWPYRGGKGQPIMRSTAAMMLRRWRREGDKVEITNWGYFYPHVYSGEYHFESPHATMDNKERDEMKRLYRIMR